MATAFAGVEGVAEGWDLGRMTMATGYFPVRGESGAIRSVLVLEAGQSFAGEAPAHIGHTRRAGLVLALVAALALGVVARRWAGAMRRQQAEGERAARAEVVSHMAASVAHDIRNPLGVIRGTVELTRRRSRATLSPRDDEALSDILGAVERLRQLTDDFLDLSADRPFGGRRLALGPLLDEAVRATKALHPSVRIDRPCDAELQVEGDGSRLTRVFRNLLSNAAEARPEGTIRLEAMIDRSEAVVRVRDEGPGVAAELAWRLIEPFATMGKTDDTGLGLAVSRRLVERKGGTLRHVRSDAGAVFEVRLPQSSERTEEA